MIDVRPRHRHVPRCDIRAPAIQQHFAAELRGQHRQRERAIEEAARADRIGARQRGIPRLRPERGRAAVMLRLGVGRGLLERGGGFGPPIGGGEGEPEALPRGQAAVRVAPLPRDVDRVRRIAGDDPGARGEAARLRIGRRGDEQEEGQDHGCGRLATVWMSKARSDSRERR